MPSNQTKSRGQHPAKDQIRYIQYDPVHEAKYVAAIRQLISKDLSEPYSIYVYRYFLYQWGDLCFMATDQNGNLIGVVVSKLEQHRGGPMRGYIAMLAVREEYRGLGIATKLVCMAIDAMIERDADEVALETEISNTSAMKLYERLGFLRSKRLHRYYLNGNSAYRLILYLKEGTGLIPTGVPDMYPPEEPVIGGDGPEGEDDDYIGDLPEEWTRGIPAVAGREDRTDENGKMVAGDKKDELGDEVLRRDEVQAV